MFKLSFFLRIVTHPCRANNGECPDFCFPKQEQGQLTRICGCRYGRKINSVNNQECIDNSQVEPTQTSCDGRFQCRNGRCIPLSYKCDGGSLFNRKSKKDFLFFFSINR
jgi:low density lipoprotein-related protein 2